jgi:hypothetical protein
MIKLTKVLNKKNLIKIFGLFLIRPYEFIVDLVRYRELTNKANDVRFKASLKSIYPCLKDKTLATSFDRHYIFHTAWAARILAKSKPESHVDFSSSLYFCSIVSSFIPIKFYDYRPAALNLSGLISNHADLTTLQFANDSIQSISCMHVIEHIGLGRYGDPLNPVGDLVAASELSRVLALGGNLLVVLPVGKPNIYFNAHRVYSYDQVKEMFIGLILIEFSLIPDDPQNGGIIPNATPEETKQQKYGCGLFWFTK